MIVLHDEKVLIATPPHTASRALHDYFNTKPNATFVFGPNPDQIIDHHYYRPIDGFVTKVVVRNPLDRLVGLWHHLVDWNAHHGDGCCSFADFIDLVAENKMSWMYCYSIARWAEVNELDLDSSHIIPHYHLSMILGLPSKTSNNNRRHWTEYYTKELHDKAVSLFLEDHRRFGAL